MKLPTINLLLIDDDQEEHFLIREMLFAGDKPRYHLEWASNFQEGIAHFQQNKHDAYLVDFHLGPHTGLELIQAALELGCTAPMVILTGTKDPETDFQAMQSGASDYLSKDDLNFQLLDRAVRYAIAQKKIEDQLRHSQVELERRVTERTVELRAAIKKLKQKNVERKHAEVALLESKKETETAHSQLRYVSQRLLQIQEAERRMIAVELHDEIGQSLTAIKLCLNAIKSNKPGNIKNLNESTRMLDLMLEQVRGMSLDLRPPQLDDLGLCAALRWLLQRCAASTEITPHFPEEFDEEKINPDVKTACFRIGQEALTNAVRHGQPRNLTVELQQENGLLTLGVHDDGRGYDVFKALERAIGGRSVGLLGMKERAELLGGKVEISSTPKKGTSVTAVFNLNQGRNPWERHNRSRLSLQTITR